MEIAYIIGGHLRKYQETGIKEKLLDKYPGDVFLFTWDVFDCNDTPLLTVIDKQEMLDYFNPVDYRIYNEEKFRNENKYNIPNLQFNYFRGINSNYFCKFKSNLLKNKANKKYDMVFNIRPDVQLENDFNPEEMNPEYLWVPRRQECVGNGYVSDFFAFSNEEYVNYYTKSFLTIHTDYPGDSSQGPEIYLAKYLKDGKMKIKTSNFKIRIKRYRSEMDILNQDGQEIISNYERELSVSSS